MPLHFYKNLETLKQPVNDVLGNAALFCSLPGDWHVVVADISNSTQAVQAGKHDDINLIAAGSLIAAINATKEFDTEIPYFFGGDGGIVIVPEVMLSKVLAGLNAHRINSLKNFSLELRIGSISVKEIMEAGHEISIAKVDIGRGYMKAVLIGNGLKYAENTIKSRYYVSKEDEKKELGNRLEDLNMEGLECRWDKIKPPTSNLEVVCFLIDSIDPKKQLQVYRDVLLKLDEFYGEPEKRHPITVKRLQLITSLKKFRKEMIVRYSGSNVFSLARSFFETLIGKLYFKYNLKFNNLKGKDYLEQIIAFSDTLTIDGRINTIVSGTRENRLQLLEYLNQQEKDGLLIYGHHVSSESVMTCYIENRNNKHIHFLDGSNGGYTEASKELKPKIKLVSSI